MTDPSYLSKRLYSALRRMRENTCQTLNGRIVTNALPYYLAEKEYIEIQERMGRENMKIIKKDPKWPLICDKCGKVRKELHAETCKPKRVK